MMGAEIVGGCLWWPRQVVLEGWESVVLRENKSERRWKGTRKTIHKTWLCMGSAALITEKEKIRVEERKWGSRVF